jgi:NAD(P)-dependent dehydrogenase (short-subunit alcohol dehydrogenase family)
MRTAIITGASRGLGATLAEFLAGQGWRVVLTARGAEELEATASRLRRHGDDVISLAGDVTNAAHRVRLVTSAGDIDLLVNNASDLGPSPLPSLTEIGGDAFRRILDVNVLAPVALVRDALPGLATAGGLVVNISSDAALGGYEGWGAYGASKAALDLISLTLANELRDARVGVVSVDPGDMRTHMHQLAFPGEDIADRPLPEITIPFWAWLIGRDPIEVTGRRYRAQAEQWEVAA